MPVRISSTRKPTSRTSLARCASNSLRSDGEAFGVQRGRALPGEGGAFSFRDRRIGDLEKIRIVEQFSVRGENGSFARISFAVELRAQGIELAARFFDCVRQPALLGFGAAAFLFHHDFGAANLKDCAHSEPG